MKSLIKNIVYFLFSPFLIRLGEKDAIYITFDDGPHPNKTENILATLKKNNAKATFFMIGEEMMKSPEIVDLIIKDGHSIGYHSYSHDSLKTISLNKAIEDLKKADDIAKKFNINIKLYRPPYGDLTLLSFLYLIISGWKVVMWSLDSRDSFDSSEEVLANVSPNNVSLGEILLFHDDYELTANILPDVLQRFNEKNIKCKAL